MDWRNKPNQIFNKVKQQMYAKGVENFTSLEHHAAAFDPQSSNALSSHALNLFLNKAGVFLSTQEIRNVRDLYAKNKGEDLILYREFLEDIKYSIPEKIASIVGEAFDCFDSGRKGAVPLQALLASYQEGQHPHCLARRKSPQEVRSQFEAALGRKADKQGLVSKQAFLDYYAELNFCIPNERESYFQQLVINTWGLKRPATHVPEKRLKEIEHTLFEKIRLKSDGRGEEWKTGKKALAYFDLGDQGRADYASFKKGLDKFGCNFQEHEMQALFQRHADGPFIHYETFVKHIMALDINGMVTQPNLFQTKMGTNHFTVTH